MNFIIEILKSSIMFKKKEHTSTCLYTELSHYLFHYLVSNKLYLISGGKFC